MADELKKVDVVQPIVPTEPVPPKKPAYGLAHYIIYFIGGLLEVVLLFRLVFKLTGADATSGFVGFIYGVTNFFVAPYAVFVFEPGTLIAMVVYAILIWGVAKIISIVVGRPHNFK